MPARTHLLVENKEVEVSNLEKVLYPKSGFTKGQVIDYYIRVAPVLMPHLKDRALTLKRYPNGVEEPFFYEKRCPSYRPKWVKTAPIWSDRKQREIGYCLANNLPSLVWAANLADLELHTSLARYQNPERPTMMVFDLDPGPPANVIDCAQAAIWVRDFLARRGLECFVKTTGSKGLQVYVPLNSPVTFEQSKEWSHRLAQHLTGEHPDRLLFKMAKALRRGKVFIDWSQNDRHKTTVCAYSLRAKERPATSTPLTWEEVETALRSRKPERLVFEAGQLLQRVEKHGDLFEPVLKLKQRLPKW